jgi:hypothetical protein
VPDLSPAGVARGLAALGGPPVDDPYDERLLSAFETAARVALGEVELHRRDPLLHVSALDLACYDREYAPAAERERARAQHLAAWPDAVDAALASLDQVPADVAAGTLSSVRGLSAGVSDEAALTAHARLVEHVERAAREGDPDPSLGGPALAALMASREALDVDLGRLAERADAERDRLRALLADACERIAPGVPVPRCCHGSSTTTPTPTGCSTRPGRSRPRSSPGRPSRGSCPTTTASAGSVRRRSRGRTPWR